MPAPKSIPVNAVVPELDKTIVLLLIVEVYVTATGVVPPPTIIMPSTPLVCANERELEVIELKRTLSPAPFLKKIPASIVPEKRVNAISDVTAFPKVIVLAVAAELPPMSKPDSLMVAVKGSHIKYIP